MLILIFGAVILDLTYGAFWHNQPARRQNAQRADPAFRLGLVNHESNTHAGRGKGDIARIGGSKL